MTWVEHMEELRRRILKSLLAVGIGMVAAFFFMDPIMAFLTRSAGTLYFLKPAEAFMTYFKVLAVVGLLLASPVWFYQLWAFLLPALTQKEKKTLLAFVPFSVLLFVGGCVFAFEIVLPRGLAFFLEFTSPAVQPLLSLESYLDFMVMLVLPFGVLFNLPLALLFLALVGLIRSAIDGAVDADGGQTVRDLRQFRGGGDFDAYYGHRDPVPAGRAADFALRAELRHDPVRAGTVNGRYVAEAICLSLKAMARAMSRWKPAHAGKE